MGVVVRVAGTGISGTATVGLTTVSGTATGEQRVLVYVGMWCVCVCVCACMRA